MKQSSLMIVIDGSDGSGKSTQFNLLKERLKAAGYDVAVFDFPQYEKESSYFVRQYLGGHYGPAADISPYTASLFYALDRYEASVSIKQALESGKIVLCNRYVGSNMAHQGGKFTNQAEQRGYFVWADNLEFELMKIPRPDITLFLRVPAEVSQNLIAGRANQTGKKLDEHEKDNNHLRQALKTYDTLCQLFPKDFSAIECTKGGRLRSIPEISNLIWEKVKPMLPKDRPHAGHSAVVTLSSDSEENASRRAVNPEKLVHEFKDVSLYLKVQIERHLRSIDPAGFTIWSDCDYKFYTPQGLPKELEAKYKEVMLSIGEKHRDMRSKLQSFYERNILNPHAEALPNISELLLPATPLAALCTFTVEMSPKSVRRICAALLANDSLELQWSAKQLYLAARQQWPEDFKSPLESESAPEPLNNIISKLAEEKLSFNSSDIKTVKLLSASPRLEFDLLAESIYPYSTLSLDEIIDEVSEWSYQQKYESLKQAAADPGLMLDKISYKFDLVTDHVLLAELTSLISGIPQTQNPSPRNGYDVPASLENAAIDEQFIECFDESLGLFSAMQQAECDDLTVYTSLLGHKLRWQMTANAQEMKTIQEHIGPNGFEIVQKAMLESVSEAHPLLWDVISGQTVSKSAINNNRVKPSRRRTSRKRK